MATVKGGVKKEAGQPMAAVLDRAEQKNLPPMSSTFCPHTGTSPRAPACRDNPCRQKTAAQIEAAAAAAGSLEARARVTARDRGEAAEWVASVKVVATDTGPAHHVRHL